MTEQETRVEKTERGNIYFFYRPKVQAEGEEHPTQGFDDVQRFYMVLSPHNQERYRLITIGQKQLPAVGAQDDSNQAWGFVDLSVKQAEQIEEALQGDVHKTKTRGTRVQPAARPAGEGVYDLVIHGDHTHLVYALELPDGPGAVQQALNIVAEGSYIFSVKNPEKPASKPVGLSPKRKADLPQKLQERFRDRQFISVDPPDFLNHAGVELLLVGASANVSGELGIPLNPEDESEQTAEIFKELRPAKSEHPVKPLFEGKWE